MKHKFTVSNLAPALALALVCSETLAQWPPRRPVQDPPRQGEQDPRREQDPGREREGDRRSDRDWSRNGRRYHNDTDSHLDDNVRSMKRSLEEIEDLLWEIQQRADEDPQGDWDRREQYFGRVQRLLERLTQKTESLNAMAAQAKLEDDRRRADERRIREAERERRESERRRDEERRRRAQEETEVMRLEGIYDLGLAKAEVNKALLMKLLVSTSTANLYRVVGGTGISIGVDNNPLVPSWHEAVVFLGNQIGVRVNRTGTIGFRTGGRNDGEWLRLVTEFQGRIVTGLEEAQGAARELQRMGRLDRDEASRKSDFVRGTRGITVLIGGQAIQLLSDRFND